ncbi:MAG: serine hydrolase domain-containing protein [Pseudomonadota bacterium]
MKKDYTATSIFFEGISMVRATLFTASLLVLLTGCSSQDAPAPLPELVTLSDPGAVDESLQAFVDEGIFPFLHMRVEDKYGRPVYQGSAVSDTLLPGEIIDENTWIRIWSMSKIITISIAMDLVEDGLIKLDDPVTKYIPEFANLQVIRAADGNLFGAQDDKEAACPGTLEPVESTMTVEHLITHEAGFYYPMTGFPCVDDALADARLPRANDTTDAVNRISEIPLLQEPGERDFYGINTTVLGFVAERASGQSLSELVRERITAPLSIEGLQYEMPNGVTLLPRFSGADGELRFATQSELDIFGDQLPDYDPDRPLYLGGEGMLATTDAYADFLRMFMNRGVLDGHRVLEESSVERMTSPHTQLDNEWGYNGYNVWVNSGKLYDGSTGVGGLWTGGGYEGTHFWIDTERELVGIIVTQIFSPAPAGRGRDDRIREAFYAQLPNADTATQAGE